MPSISGCQLTQLVQSMPLDWGLPHKGQIGGATGGSEFRHEEQIRLPSFPQPTHHCGNKRLIVISPSLAN